jgi:hypothetical protein
MKNLSNGIFVGRIAGLLLVQSLPILPVDQGFQNSSLYFLALFKQLFEASQINNLAQNS